ncbi:hypothetical protein H0H93_007893, partial [Arthromyces matolae]
TKPPRKSAFSATASAINALIERYSLDLKPLPEQSTPLQGPLVVLLTGSTGNLGSEILADLLENDRVERVYTFNRPSKSGDTIEERQLRPFRERGLNTEVLCSSKLSHVIGDATQADLGIGRDQYLALGKSVNVVIHNAWLLSFTCTLSELEPHIQATRHLVDFLRAGEHSAHARFLFTSSITSAQSWPLTGGPYPEEVVTDPSFAVGPGYGASKYVAERIIAKSGLNATSFRIGQICGGAPQGAWDTTEWMPALVKTSIALRSFPDIKGGVHTILIVDALLDPDERCGGCNRRSGFK